MGLLSNLLSAKILYLKKDLTMWKCFFSFPIKHVTSLLLGCSANAVPAPELKYCYHLGYFRIKSVLLGTSKDWFRGFAIAYRRKWNVSINQVLINQIFCWFSQKIICPLGNKAPRKIKKYFHEQVVVVGVVVVGVVVVASQRPLGVDSHLWGNGRYFVPLSFLPAFLLPDLLASHLRTDWLSRLGLGNQVVSATHSCTYL